jgi:hypothetical protein
MTRDEQIQDAMRETVKVKFHYTDGPSRDRLPERIERKTELCGDCLAYRTEHCRFRDVHPQAKSCGDQSIPIPVDAWWKDGNWNRATFEQPRHRTWKDWY